MIVWTWAIAIHEFVCARVYHVPQRSLLARGRPNELEPWDRTGLIVNAAVFGRIIIMKDDSYIKVHFSIIQIVTTIDREGAIFLRTHPCIPN